MITHSYIALSPIVSVWFQVLFHSPPGVLFTFPSRYSFTIGHQVVFSLTPWSGLIPTEFHVLRSTWVHTYQSTISFIYETFTLFGHSFQSIQLVYCFLTRDLYFSISLSLYPHIATNTVLHDISFGSSRFAHHYSGNHFVFFSWHYLDVSVHAVRFLTLCIQIRIQEVCSCRLPHSDISGSQLG